MAVDIRQTTSNILEISSFANVNNTYIVAGVLPTGRYNSRLVNTTNTIIGNIESKYQDRFDNPSYYYGGGADGGNIA